MSNLKSNFNWESFNVQDKGMDDSSPEPAIDNQIPTPSSKAPIERGIDDVEEVKAPVATTEEIVEDTKVDKTKSEESKKKDEKVDEKAPDTTFTSIVPAISKLIENGFITEEEVSEHIEDSPEGVESLARIIAEKKIEEGKKMAFDDLSDNAKRLIELDKEGVDVRQLLSLEENENDFSAIKAELADNVDLQQEIYFDFLIATGASQEKAQMLLQKAVDTDTLFDMAEAGANFLEKAQSDEKKNFIESQKQEAKKAQELERQEFERFKNDILSTTTIKGFPVAKDEVTKLHDFMLKQDPKTGKTGEQKAWEDAENRKLFAYLTMKGFDFKALEKKVETKKTIEFKKKVDNITDKGMTSKGGKIEAENTKSTPVVGGLDFYFKGN